MTAEYIQWQKTVVPVTTVLFTVYRVIGRIEVQYQLFRCTLRSPVDELIEQHFVQPPGSLPISPVLKTA